MPVIVKGFRVSCSSIVKTLVLLVDTFNQVEQHHILQELSGSFQTEMQKSKWASDATGQCRHCQDFDDRFHRILAVLPLLTFENRILTPCSFSGTMELMFMNYLSC